MANASLGDIYNRMHSVADYHPFTADTYADWSLEAGDIVTVERNGVQSASPVHTATVRWNGSQRVTLESRGEKEREPVAKMSARAFNSGGNGGGGYRSGYRGRKKTDEDVADLWVESGKIYGYARNVEDTLRAEIDITKENIRLEVINRENKDRELTGKINVQSERIDVVLTENGQVRAGVIVDAINKDPTVTITAAHIMLDGNVNLNSVMSVSGNYVRMKKPVVVENYVQATEVRLRSGASGVTLTESNMQHVIISATVKNNTLTLTPLRGDPINFSKATTLTGEWSGNVDAGKSYKVTAKQNNIVVGTPHYSPALDGYYIGSRHWSGNTYLMPVTVYDEKGTDLFRDDVDVTGAYNDGRGSAPSYSRFGYFGRLGSQTIEGITYQTYVMREDRQGPYAQTALYEKD